MSSLSQSMKLSDLQSTNSIINNEDNSNFSSIMQEKESNDKEFIEICERMNNQIIETRDEIQSLMIKSSAFCASVGTKTESVIFPSKSPRHQISPKSISDSLYNSLTPTKPTQNMSTPRKSNYID